MCLDFSSINFFQAYLEDVIADDSSIRKQDGSRALRSVCQNRIGRDVAWDWLRNDYNRIRSYFGLKSGIGGPIEDMVTSIASDFNTKLKLEELQEFYDEHVDDFGVDNRAIQKAIQMVKANINWMSTNYNTIADWLNNRSPDETTTSEPVTTPSKSSHTSSNAICILFTCIASLISIK